MKSHLLAASLVLLGAFVLAPGCTTSSGPVADTWLCSPDGHICDYGVDCCSNVCAGGICATPVGGCTEDDLGCTSDGECCSGVCGSNNLCGFPPPGNLVTCNVDNQACTKDADCCSFLCASDNFCGVPTTSCNLDNDPCNVDSDCCSNLCATDGYCGL